MNANLALQANSCYNEVSNIVVSGDAVNISRPVANLYWRSTTMDTIPSTSGIYKITCTANGKIYIGSALDLRNRRHHHFNALRKNKHENSHLQNAWNKYGEQSFIFEVLELVLIPELLTVQEQYWFKKLNPFGKKGFNIYREAGSPLGAKRSSETREKIRQANLGKKLSPEHRAKIGQTHLGMKRSSEARERMRGRKHTPEEIEVVRQANLGRKHTPEHIEKNRQAQLNRSPEVQEKMRQANLGRKHTAEARANMGRSHLGYKHTPEAIERMRQSQASLELQERKRHAMLGRKMSPETIAKRSATRTGMRYKKKEKLT